MLKSKFTMDVLGKRSFEGWTTGDDWNGWATPWFEYAEVVRLVEHFNTLDWKPEKKAWYDNKDDQFCFVLDGQTDPECYSGEWVDVGEQKIKLYPIGTRVWVWEEQ